MAHTAATEATPPCQSVTATSGGKNGRTPTGVTFTVPETRDFLENLGAKRHNVFEKVTIAWIILQVLVFLFSGWSKYLFVISFVLWRLSYNAGIGYLLHTQSHHNLFVRFVSKLLAPDAPTHDFLRRHLSLKMGKDYNFDSVPIEYNCWLVFRGIVDIILLNDFAAYMVMVFAYAELPSTLTLLDVTCYVVGILLCIFNWFIKLDALRVVKDYAWYWGDFFFLLDGNLSFDGVFKIAPHPMYSIGYIGYYGMSLISRSYVVLYCSLAAHLCQFVFLALVENPHIDKVYNSLVSESQVIRRRREILYEGPSAYFRRDLIGWKNFDSFRAADLLTAGIVLYNVVIFAMGAPAWFHVLHCVFWRLLHTIGLGVLLKRQSETKFWTAHFIKFGHSLNDAFANWKSIYNLSLTMTHVSFFFCAISFYHQPESWFSGSGLLKHTLASLLILLHVWAASEVYEVIQDYGWFYGDFFLPRPSARTLSYSGIYRFVNNPEKILCHASFWAFAVLSDSFLVYALALFSQCATFAFIHYVEQPHMKKIYGHEVRQRAGFEEGILEAVRPPPEFVDGMAKITRHGSEIMRGINAKALKDVTEPIEQLVDMAKPHLRGLVHDLSDTTIQITRRSIPLPDDMDVSKYSVEIKDKATFVLGEDIQIGWTAPTQHSALDWIAIYPYNSQPVALTARSSEGRWEYLSKESTGVLSFTGSHLPVVPGKYEARLHYDDHHGVLARSVPFTLELGPAFNHTNPSDRISVDDLQDQLLVLFKTVFADAVDGGQVHIDERTPFVDLSRHLSKDHRKWRAQTIVRFIKTVYNVEFAPRILESYPSVAMLTCKLHESRIVLGADPGTSSEDEGEKYTVSYRRRYTGSKVE